MDNAEFNAISGDPTDNRKEYDWRTHYPAEAKKQIHVEAGCLVIGFFFSLFVILAIWKGWMMDKMFFSLSVDEVSTLRKYAYYTSSGFLGGITFGMKVFYRFVARGYWHQDRRIWRFMSPFIAMAVSFIIGTLIDSGMILAQKSITTPVIVSIGFLAGYFADEAVGKMCEIAHILFGRSAVGKTAHGK